MRFVAYDIKKLRRNGKPSKMLVEFSEAGIKCARVEDWKYASAETGARSINESAQKLHMPHIRASVRNGEIYLINDLVK